MNRRTIAIVMDPIAHINYAKDTTLAMAWAAQDQGYDLLYLTQSDLWLRDGIAYGRVRPLEVFRDPARWFALGEPRVTRLGDIYALLKIGRAHV